MKKKAIFTIMLACIITASVFAGCTKKDTGTNSSTPNSSTPESSAPAKAESGMLTKAKDAITAAYGDIYIQGSFEVDEAMFEEMYGIKKELYKEYYVHASPINTQVDTVIGVEAAEGKADELETAMKAYRDKVIADKEAFPYLPDHLPKAKAAQVVRVDDYVFYVMIADTFEATEDTMDQAIKDGIQKGVNAINDTLKK